MSGRYLDWARVPVWLWVLAAVMGIATIAASWRWSEWQEAMTADDARASHPEVAAQIMPSWTTVIISNGTVREWPYGTITGNPDDSNIAFLLLVACPLSLLFLMIAIWRLAAGWSDIGD